MSRSAGEQVDLARKRGVCVFGETLAAAIGTDGTHYLHKCWRHAAGHVISPPLRPDTDTPRVLVNMLAKWVKAGDEFRTTLTSKRARMWIYENPSVCGIIDNTQFEDSSLARWIYYEPKLGRTSTNSYRWTVTFKHRTDCIPEWILRQIWYLVRKNVGKHFRFEIDAMITYFLLKKNNARLVFS